MTHKTTPDPAALLRIPTSVTGQDRPPEALVCAYTRHQGSRVRLGQAKTSQAKATILIVPPRDIPIEAYARPMRTFLKAGYDVAVFDYLKRGDTHPIRRESIARHGLSGREKIAAYHHVLSKLKKAERDEGVTKPIFVIAEGDSARTVLRHAALMQLYPRHVIALDPDFTGVSTVFNRLKTSIMARLPELKDFPHPEQKRPASSSPLSRAWIEANPRIAMPPRTYAMALKDRQDALKLRNYDPIGVNVTTYVSGLTTPKKFDFIDGILSDLRQPKLIKVKRLPDVSLVGNPEQFRIDLIDLVVRQIDTLCQPQAKVIPLRTVAAPG